MPTWKKIDWSNVVIAGITVITIVVIVTIAFTKTEANVEFQQINLNEHIQDSDKTLKKFDDAIEASNKQVQSNQVLLGVLEERSESTDKKLDTILNILLKQNGGK